MTTPPPSSLLIAAEGAATSGEGPREGFESPGAEAFEWPSVLDIDLFGIDLSINRVVILTFLAAFIVAVLFLIAFRKPKLVPRGLQNFMETGVDFIRNQIILPTLGREGLVFLPYLTTLFFFILVMNLFEVVPGINFPPTSRFGIPLVLAVATFVMFVYVGFKNHGVTYIKDVMFPPGVPWPIYIVLTPIEIVSTFLVRPFSLAIRLMANMIAGHLLLTVLFFGTAYLYGAANTIPFAILATGASVAAVGFEIFVACLQAFIFVMLTAVYLSMSKEPAH